MIRHVVLIRFAADTSQEEIDAIFADLARLRQAIPGFVAFAGGADISPEGLAKGYGHVFTADFRSEADRDAYLVHPDHQAAGGRLVRAAAGGIDGLVVIDIAM